MPVVVACPSCSKSYRVREENLGSQANCRACGHPFTLQIRNDEYTNTVTIYQVGADGEVVYIAMELVDGESLDKTVKDHSPMDWREPMHDGHGRQSPRSAPSPS